MKNVTFFPRTSPEQRQVSDGGDAPVVGLLHVQKNANVSNWLWSLLVFYVVLAGFMVALDIGVMKTFMTAKFSDEFGLVADGKGVWIWLTSFMTVVFFFVIGRLYYAGSMGRKSVAAVLYAVLLCFLAINIYSSYLGDFLQIFGASSSGWGASVAGVVDSAPQLFKVVFMLIVSVVMTGAGLGFAWAERRAELTFKELMLNSTQMAEAQGVVNAYQEVKNQTDADAEEEKRREERHEFFSDDDNNIAVGKTEKARFLKTYLTTLQTRFAAIPTNTLQMSRAEQESNDAKRREISALINKAQSLTI
jgi:hypothetical protein